MIKLNEAVYTTIYKTIKEVVDIKNARTYGVADVKEEIKGVFESDLIDAYEAHEWKADRWFGITDLEAFEEAVKDYDIKVTAEQWKTINADPEEYHEDCSEMGDLLEEVEAVADCVLIEYSHTHKLDGYEVAITVRDYDTFLELYDRENEEQINYYDAGDRATMEDLTNTLEYYFSEEINQACDDFFNNEVLSEFSDAVKKEYKRQYKRYYSDELEENITNLIEIEEDFSYHMEEDVNKATLINFKRQIKDLQKKAPEDWESLKRGHKNQSSDSVTIQFTDALAKACKDLGVDYDDYTDNDLHDDYECTEWLNEYIEQEGREV